MNTRKYPRTMVEAFGPYTSNKLEPMDDGLSDRSKVWAARVYAVVLAVAITAVCVGVPS